MCEYSKAPVKGRAVGGGVRRGRHRQQEGFSRMRDRTIRRVRGRGRRRRSQEPDRSAGGLQGVFEPPRAEHLRPTLGPLRWIAAGCSARLLVPPALGLAG